MEELSVTWCHSRRRYGDKLPCQPSSFFKEFAAEEIIETDYETLESTPVEEDFATDYFERMKSMLSS